MVDSSGDPNLATMRAGLVQMLIALSSPTGLSIAGFILGGVLVVLGIDLKIFAEIVRLDHSGPSSDALSFHSHVGLYILAVSIGCFVSRLLRKRRGGSKKILARLKAFREADLMSEVEYLTLRRLELGFPDEQAVSRFLDWLEDPQQTTQIAKQTRKSLRRLLTGYSKELPSDSGG